jgi:hypothetical protein
MWSRQQSHFLLQIQVIYLSRSTSENVRGLMGFKNILSNNGKERISSEII